MYAVGSAYFMSQSPGAERMGGFRITLRRKQEAVGRITVNPTDFLSSQTDTWIGEFVAKQAIAGITDVAKIQGIELSEFDVELSSFLVHDVDSAPLCYFQAGKSAFRAALEMWFMKDLPAQ